MTQFLRLLSEQDKGQALASACARFRMGGDDPRIFDVEPESFDGVPGKSFAYWVSDSVRRVFKRFSPFENDDRTARQGLATAEDFRFVRA
jgi:hypothetical protein